MASNNWSGRPNGQIPVSMMNQFRSTGKYLQPDACTWLDRLFTAGSAAGYNFTISPEQDLYRDLAKQNQLYPGTPSNPVARPGTSNHGWGLAADVTGWEYGKAWSWLLANSKKYNYQMLTVPVEKWHWLYVGPTTTTAGGGITPINNTEKEGNMAYLIKRSDGEVSVLIPRPDSGTMFGRHPLSPADYNRFIAGGSVEAQIDDGNYNKYPII